MGTTKGTTQTFYERRCGTTSSRVTHIIMNANKKRALPFLFVKMTYHFGKIMNLVYDYRI
jgi:hypothetical protein